MGLVGLDPFAVGLVKLTNMDPCPSLLHWLRIPRRIWFRLSVLMCSCLDDTAPSYLADSICQVAVFEVRRHLCSSATTTLVVPPNRPSTLRAWATGHSLVHGRIEQTVCRHPFELQRHSLSDENWRHFVPFKLCRLLSRQPNVWLCKVPLQRYCDSVTVISTNVYNNLIIISLLDIYNWIKLRSAPQRVTGICRTGKWRTRKWRSRTRANVCILACCLLTC